MAEHYIAFKRLEISKNEDLAAALAGTVILGIIYNRTSTRF